MKPVFGVKVSPPLAFTCNAPVPSGTLVPAALSVTAPPRLPPPKNVSVAAGTLS